MDYTVSEVFKEVFEALYGNKLGNLYSNARNDITTIFGAHRTKNKTESYY